MNERRCNEDAHARILTELEERCEYVFPHQTRDTIPIISLERERASGARDGAGLLRMFHDVLDLRRDLLWRIFTDRKTRYRFIGIAFLIEKKVCDTAFLGRNDREPCCKGLDK